MVVDLYSEHFLLSLIPNENPNFFNILVILPKIMFVRQFSWTLIEVAFDLFLFDFSDIYPFTAIFTNLWFPKNIILQ